MAQIELIAMIPNLPCHMPQSPIYKKAVDIFMLSRSIADYLSDDLAMLKSDGSEDPHVYFSGDIVQQSVSLAPEILKAEQQSVREDKHKHAAYVSRLASMLYKNCERLERANSNGTEFLPLLRTELKKFRKLQRNWMLTF
jgi:hypothetical protein